MVKRMQGSLLLQVL
uniref:Uncharacterized protein n=1 Tax=Arundo donax TaxID=35708 RepID=A0A0A9EH51_ARUDO